MERAVNLIVIHCSATASGRSLRVGGLNAADIIDGWHRERGFARQAAAVAAFNTHLPHIGYHYVVDLGGNVYTGRGLEEVGAHVAGHNANSVGICLVGGAERDAQFTPAQWKSLKTLVLALHLQLAVPLAAPRRNGDEAFDGICGHRDLSPDLNHDGVIAPNEWLKTCPGFNVAAWLANGLEPEPKNIFGSNA